jgi:4-hydroxybenzoate polyprenyltransferase
LVKPSVVHAEEYRLDAPHGLRAAVRLMRPRQWVKNGLVFAALLFSGRLLEMLAVGQALVAFAVFCLAASGIYCFNDALDADRDALHPKKRFRPVASGAIRPWQAHLLAAALSVGALALGFALHPSVAVVVAVYQAINLLYSTWLKNVVFIDIMAVASGFVLRAIGGAFAIDVEASKWFLACVLLLSLFLAVGKRRNEVVTVGDPGSHRKVLDEYPVQLLDQMVAVLSGSVIVTYLLYALESDRPPLFFVTSLFVIYGIFRYLYLVYGKAEGGAPEETLLSDLPLLITVALWGVASGAIIYFS